MNRPTPPGPSRDSKTDLLRAAEEAVKDREEKAVADRIARLTPARRRRRFQGLILLGLVGATLLTIQPTWLVGPKAPPVETPAVAAASLRLTLVRERQRIVDYRTQTGRLPATLAEAGGILETISYERVGAEDFRLSARTGDSVIVLRAADSVSTHLGKSFKVLKERGRE
ncbi:MAG: hypothetical protein HOP28_01900 [Gemmatimonadales bacterium]|nr:hypothetical protein [Gemmatimonadales bacterium]